MSAGEAERALACEIRDSLGILGGLVQTRLYLLEEVPADWDKERLESFLRAGQARGFWTWSLAPGVGIALILGDALFDAHEAEIAATWL